jgi:hypothetical protein
MTQASQPFRWRWQLLAVALCLAVAGSLGFLLLDQRRPHELRQAFSRVQLGMSESDVQAVLEQDVVRGVDEWPSEDDPILVEAIEHHPQEFKISRKMTPYRLKSGEILVEFANGRAATKFCLRHPTVWDKLRAFLGRIRAVVGL